MAKIEVKCSNCGNKFWMEDYKKKTYPKEEMEETVSGFRAFIAPHKNIYHLCLFAYLQAWHQVPKFPSSPQVPPPSSHLIIFFDIASCRGFLIKNCSLENYKAD